MHQVGFYLNEYIEMHGQQNIKLCLNCIGLFFFGPCIFNNEDKKINQQKAQINSGLIYY